VDAPFRFLWPKNNKIKQLQALKFECLSPLFITYLWYLPLQLLTTISFSPKEKSLQEKLKKLLIFLGLFGIC
jgi:hypothetical protein